MSQIAIVQVSSFKNKCATLSPHEISIFNYYILFYFFYSYLKASTGFRVAALQLCQLTKCQRHVVMVAFAMTRRQKSRRDDVILFIVEFK